MDCNGSVNANDHTMYFLPTFKGAFGAPVPGPSGLSCAGLAPCP